MSEDVDPVVILSEILNGISEVIDGGAVFNPIAMATEVTRAIVAVTKERITNGRAYRAQRRLVVEAEQEIEAKQAALEGAYSRLDAARENIAELSRESVSNRISLNVNDTVRVELNCS
jgi:hypothetical protein